MYADETHYANKEDFLLNLFEENINDELEIWKNRFKINRFFANATRTKLMINRKLKFRSYHTQASVIILSVWLNKKPIKRIYSTSLIWFLITNYFERNAFR